MTTTAASLEVFHSNKMLGLSQSGKILVKKGNVYLLQFPGENMYTGSAIKPYTYFRSFLTIVDLDQTNNGWGPDMPRLHEGRVSRKVLLSLKEKIDSVFGAGTTEKIDLKTTLVL